MRETSVIEIEPVTLVEVKELLKNRKSEKELNYEQELTMKYVEKFARLTKKQTDDLINSLKEISFLKDNKELLYQIVYALPINIEQVKLFVPKDVEVSEEELNKIVAQMKKFGEKE
ncbi:MAG: hypothetical protein PHP82_01480 [Candidatus ainarchaeum sp.]|nr:hypothetical protein [Candidatus ainarchaeum sp.]